VIFNSAALNSARTIYTTNTNHVFISVSGFILTAADRSQSVTKVSSATIRQHKKPNNQIKQPS